MRPVQRARKRTADVLAAAILAMLLFACAPNPQSERVAKSTLVVGIDVSGSFRSGGRYDSAIDFAANYLYAHIHGLGGLRVPTALFVGTVGGDVPGETKSFQPIHTFQGMTVREIATFLRREYPSRDGLTDFNPFFSRVATLIQRQGLVLAPLNVVILSDGVPDAPGIAGRYDRIDVSPLEYLSRSVTVRVLFPSPTIAVDWEHKVKRHRVRMWTVDNEVMATWRKQYAPDASPEGQGALWKWISDNVDFRVRTGGMS
ncbi:MAG: hypothetical protein PVSMB1_02880 [Gemmatimonadaceae bacterium]